jgi:hypothetical protein
MELENIILIKVSKAQQTKNHTFFLICSNVAYRANAAMLLDLSHMTRGEHIQEVWG